MIFIIGSIPVAAFAWLCYGFAPQAGSLPAFYTIVVASGIGALVLFLKGLKSYFLDDILVELRKLTSPTK